MHRRKIISIVLLSLLASSLTLSGAQGVVALKATSAPAIPLIIGTGSQISVTPAKWNIAEKSHFQWILAGKAIPGATKNSLKVLAKYLGSVIQVQEIAVGASGKSQTSLSNKVTIGRMAISANPTIAFTDDKKVALVATIPSVQPTTAVPHYVWQRGPFEIPGATEPNYTLASADEGVDRNVKVVFTAKGFTSSRVESAVIFIPAKPRTYSLLWSDEFSSAPGSPIDSKIWTPENGDGTAQRLKGWGNQERQWYADTQTTMDGSGNAVISATRTGANAFNCYYKAPCEWQSSRFITKGKVGFKYGRIEARIKGPVGTGTWAAFWMLGANIDDLPWPVCGEIDIAELLGRTPNTVYGTLHGPLSGGSGRGGTTDLTNGFADGYHTYAVDWLPDQITWYVDGQAYTTVNKSDKDWVFNQEFYILINLAMGGIFGGPIDPSVTDATTSFDYIKVFSINGIGEVIQH